MGKLYNIHFKNTTGFRQAYADDPDDFDPDHPDGGETAAAALRRTLAGNPHLPALLALL